MGKDDDDRVASEDRYAFDEAGIRRFIRGGDRVPDGWTVEEPKPKPRSPRRVPPKDKA